MIDQYVFKILDIDHGADMHSEHGDFLMNQKEGGFIYVNYGLKGYTWS